MANARCKLLAMVECVNSPETILRCPLCQTAWAERPDRAAWRCESGHSFDRARQGYINLLVGAGTKFRADTAQMVEARERFQAAGHYVPLRNALHEHVSPGVLLDAGCGTGYYSKGALYSSLVGVDLSPAAARRAARLERSTVFVADLWSPLPLEDASVQTVLNVFAPHNPSEFRRVLSPGGRAVVVTAGEGHLSELRDMGLILGQKPDKKSSLAATFGVEPQETQTLRVPLALTEDEAVDLAAMGPAGHHSDRGELSHRLSTSLAKAGARRTRITAEAVFDITVFSWG